MCEPAVGSLAQVRILLLPVGGIRRSTFERWAGEIRSFEQIRLGDIPTDGREERARFMPSPLATGHMHLSFPTHPPSSNLSPYALFRPSSHILGVIGVASCSNADSFASIASDFAKVQAYAFPEDAVQPLAKFCFIFEDDAGSSGVELSNQSPGFVIIPNMMGNKRIYLGTLLADLCSHILGEFSMIAKALDNPNAQDALNADVFPNLPLSSSLASAPTNSHRNDTRRSQIEFYSDTKDPTSVLKRQSSIAPPRSSTLPQLPSAAIKRRQSPAIVSNSHARLYKLLGDFFLLAGRTMDASIWYNEAIALFKLPQDFVWHAAALEGVATTGIADAWASGHGLNASVSGPTEPWNEYAEKMIKIIDLYSKAASIPESELHRPWMTQLFTSAVVRHASLLFAIWSAKGWGPLAFTAMLHPEPSPYIPPTLVPPSNTIASLERMSQITGITRSDIANVLTQAHGPWLLHLGPRERIDLLEAIASMYSALGYRRKQAYILREVVSCIVDLVEVSRKETGGTGTASLSASGALNSGASTMSNGTHGRIGVRTAEDSSGNSSLLQVIKHVCSVHGINVDTVRLDAGPKIEALDTPEDLTTVAEPEDVSVLGWTELQVGIVREALAVAETLPDFAAAARFCASALATLRPMLTPDDQAHFFASANKALSIARRRGEDLSLEYWTGNPIVSIEFIPLPPVRAPTERSSLDLARSKPLKIANQTDPFLYNPRRSTAGKRATLVVENEDVQFLVHLRNPFYFPLNLVDLTLSTSGVPFETNTMSLAVPENSMQTVTFIGRPKESGSLTIRGCLMQSPLTSRREFVYEIDEDAENSSRPNSLLLLGANPRQILRPSDARPASAARRASQQALAQSLRRFLEFKVVSKQPLLCIRRTSLTLGAVMLYEGEKSSIHMTLENVSESPIDFLQVDCSDSTIDVDEEALAEGDLPALEAYEAEYDLVHRTAFRWETDDSPTHIPPGTESTVVISCLGKASCSNGVIQFTYSCSDQNQPSEDSDVESSTRYTRQLQYPISVTVYQSLECHNLNIFPISGMEAALEHDSVLSHDSCDWRGLVSDVDRHGWCILTLDIRNIYGLPFEVTLVRTQDGANPASISQVIPPGFTRTFVMPIKRFALSASATSEPIPSLTNRQFVVGTLSKAEETAQRELFWYREELFKSVKAEWREVNGARFGHLSLRKQRFTPWMLQILRMEPIRVDLSLCTSEEGPEDDAAVKTEGRLEAQFACAPYNFVSLKANVQNLSSSARVLTLVLDIEPREYMCSSGVLSDVPLGLVQPDERRSFQCDVCFMACGRYKISARTRIVQVDKEELGSEDVHVTAVVKDS